MDDVEIAIAGVRDFEALGREWRALEERADPSFFQSWTWTGCLAAERFAAPVLVAARRAGQVVGLGLCNAAGSAWSGPRLLLGESGDPARDSIYVEHNGLLIARGQPPMLAATMLRALMSTGGRFARRRRIGISGIDLATCHVLQAAGLAVRIRAARPAWVADLARLRHDGVAYLDRRGVNTRRAIRRSDRSYGQEGPIRVTRAATLAEARAYLDELAKLHQAYWMGRGRPGAFQEPFFTRFHQALIARGLPRDEIDLLRVATPRGPIGLLYNFRHRGTVSYYQSGFDYAAGDPARKPGFTAQAAAIAAYAAAGLDAYDFLAGDAAYKRSLADSYRVLAWVEVG
jgi:CelD/BcsL family acetyltransferase involved in cellulose biosynthesis